MAIITVLSFVICNLSSFICLSMIRLFQTMQIPAVLLAFTFIAIGGDVFYPNERFGGKRLK